MKAQWDSYRRTRMQHRSRFRFLPSCLFAIVLAFAANVRGDVIDYWRFEEGSGTNVTDQTGAANGIVVDNNLGGNAWSAGVPLSAVPQTSETNTSSFNLGNITAATLKPTRTIQLGYTFTLEFYIRFGDRPYYSDPGGYIMSFYGTSWMRVGVYCSDIYCVGRGLYFTDGVEGVSFPWGVDTEWHHFAFVDQLGWGTMYFDGVPVASGKVTQQFTFGVGDSFDFGEPATTRAIPPFQIDEVRISNTALKPWQFLNATTPPPFQITGIARQGDDVLLTWPAFGGTANRVQLSAGRGDGSYSNDFASTGPTILVPGFSVGSTNYLDIGGATNTTRYYRIAVVAPPASDNASDPAYSGGWNDSGTGGTGFNPWVLTATGVIGSSSNGFFIGSSTNNAFGTSPGIDITGKSWGIYANSNNFTAAYRSFAGGALQVGQSFSISMDNGLIDGGNSVGFVLRNGNASSSAGDYNVGARFEFLFLGGSSSYAVVDSAGYQPIGVPFTGTGLRLVFTLNTANTYTLLTIDNASNATNTFTGTLTGSGSLDSLAIYNRNAGNNADHDAFFNSLQIISP